MNDDDDDCLDWYMELYIDNSIYIRLPWLV